MINFLSLPNSWSRYAYKFSQYAWTILIYFSSVPNTHLPLIISNVVYCYRFSSKMTRLGKIKDWMVMMNEKLNLKTIFAPSTIAAVRPCCY